MSLAEVRVLQPVDALQGLYKLTEATLQGLRPFFFMVVRVSVFNLSFACLLFVQLMFLASLIFIVNLIDLPFFAFCYCNLGKFIGN